MDTELDAEEALAHVADKLPVGQEAVIKSSHRQPNVPADDNVILLENPNYGMF